MARTTATVSGLLRVPIIETDGGLGAGGVSVNYYRAGDTFCDYVYLAYCHVYCVVGNITVYNSSIIMCYITSYQYYDYDMF
ncbi:hypothetical protein J6590_091531 [Homalodisca vitripennis]|nr:hypothetical protein J6590_091531 [Homalodisca vitripennis]